MFSLQTTAKHIAFHIPIAPKPSNKRRAAMVGGHARVVQDKGVVHHQAMIAALTAQHRPVQPLVGPLSVSILCVLPRPAYLCKVSKRDGTPLTGTARLPHASRPDADNVAKSVLDGLSAFWGDDCQVCCLHVEKWIAALGEQPHYEVQIETITV